MHQVHLDWVLYQMARGKLRNCLLRRRNRQRQRRRRNGHILSQPTVEPTDPVVEPVENVHEATFNSDYLVRFCEDNWTGWTQAMTDEMLRLIRENLDNPSDDTQSALVNQEAITEKFEKVK